MSSRQPIAADPRVPYRDRVTDTLPHVDPHTDAFHQNPFPTYAMLRAEAPVYEIPDQPGLWFVTTWSLVREALLDPARFEQRAAPGPPGHATAGGGRRDRGDPRAGVARTPRPSARTIRRSTPATASSSTAPSRRASLAWMEPLVEDVSENLAARTARTTQVVDIIDTVTTVPLPVWAILRILGLPEDRYRDDLSRAGRTAARPAHSVREMTAGALAARSERDMLEFQQAICGEPRRCAVRQPQRGPAQPASWRRRRGPRTPLTNRRARAGSCAS